MNGNSGILRQITPVLHFLFVSAVVLITGYTTLLTDTEKALEQQQRKKLDLLQEYRTKRNVAQNLPAYQRQLAVLVESFDELLRALPDSITQPAVHADIARVAGSSGIEVRKFSFDRIQNRDFYAENLYNFQLESDFKSIFSFIEGFYSLPGMGAIRRLKIIPYGENLRADFNVSFYRYLSEEAL